MKRIEIKRVEIIAFDDTDLQHFHLYYYIHFVNRTTDQVLLTRYLLLAIWTVVTPVPDLPNVLQKDLVYVPYETGSWN